jgi:hypothetical protein
MIPNLPIARSIDWCASPAGTKYVHDVWNPDLQKLIDDRRKDLKRSGVDDDGNQLFKPIAVRTINRTTTRLLRRVLLFVRDNHGQALHEPPITFGKFLKGQMKEKKRPPRVITLREAVTLKNTERPDLTPPREFAGLTTLRLEECLITWPQVDFATRKIRLVQKGVSGARLTSRRPSSAFSARSRGIAKHTCSPGWRRARASVPGPGRNLKRASAIPGPIGGSPLPGGATGPRPAP